MMLQKKIRFYTRVMEIDRILEAQIINNFEIAVISNICKELKEVHGESLKDFMQAMGHFVEDS